jgi:hypothetical protein
MWHFSESDRRMLVQACIVVGDETVLAERLQVSVKVVVDWLLGDAPVPLEVFPSVVDIVLSATRKQVEDNGALIERIKGRHRRLKP